MRVSSQIRTLHTDHGYALQIKKKPPMNGKTGRSEQVQQKNDDNNYYLFACGQITNHSRRCPMLIWLNR